MTYLPLATPIFALLGLWIGAHYGAKSKAATLPINIGGRTEMPGLGTFVLTEQSFTGDGDRRRITLEFQDKESYERDRRTRSFGA